MKKNVLYSSIVSRYEKIDEEGFIFGIKYPGYLSVTGNLSVSFPSVNDGELPNSLIIWPDICKGYEYGVIIEDAEIEYMIYIDENGNALDSEFDEIADLHKNDIGILLSKAKSFWDIE